MHEKKRSYIFSIKSFHTITAKWICINNYKRQQEEAEEEV